MVKTRLCTGGMVWKATTSKEEAIRRWSGGPASRTPHSIRPEVPVLRKAGLVGRGRRDYRPLETARPLPDSPLAKNAGAVYLLSLARGPGTRGRELYAHRKEAGGKDRAAVFGTIYIDL